MADPKPLPEPPRPAAVIIPSHRVGSTVLVIAAAVLLTAATIGISRSTLFACGVDIVGLTYSNCLQAPASSPRDPSLDRLAALETESENLERQLRQARASLRPPAACEPPRQAMLPQPPAPAAQPKQAPPTSSAIAPEKWENKDISSLEGCWELGSDYQIRNRQTGVVSQTTSWSVCFDGKGNGRQRLTLSDGRVCQGAVNGRFKSSSRLEFADEADVQCDNNSRIFKREVGCDRQDAQILNCHSYQPETSGRSDVTLKRK